MTLISGLPIENDPESIPEVAYGEISDDVLDDKKFLELSDWQALETIEDAKLAEHEQLRQELQVGMAGAVAFEQQMTAMRAEIDNYYSLEAALEETLAGARWTDDDEAPYTAWTAHIASLGDDDSLDDDLEVDPALRQWEQRKLDGRARYKEKRDHRSYVRDVVLRTADTILHGTHRDGNAVVAVLKPSTQRIGIQVGKEPEAEIITKVPVSVPARIAANFEKQPYPQPVGARQDVERYGAFNALIHSDNEWKAAVKLASRDSTVYHALAYMLGTTDFAGARDAILEESKAKEDARLAKLAAGTNGYGEQHGKKSHPGKPVQVSANAHPYSNGQRQQQNTYGDRTPVSLPQPQEWIPAGPTTAAPSPVLLGVLAASYLATRRGH